MTVKTLDAFFRNVLNIGNIKDVSLNGLQVGRLDADVRKIAFAVDACMETFERARLSDAGLLFVHHGLFWGNALPVTGGHRDRIKFLLDADIALYAAHLPLDMHPQYGNNAVLARKLGIETPEPFGDYHGIKIGYKGVLKNPLTVEEAVARVSFMERPPVNVIPFGEATVRSAAIVSGGAASLITEAVADGVDLFLTGESAHTWYHYALESRMNVIAGGHYATEVWGVRAIMELCALEFNIDVEFIDVPTGL
jgi:dinuclear metal center YbgI/SA1388 family protein